MKTPEAFRKLAGFFHQDADVVFSDGEYLRAYMRHHLSASEISALSDFSQGLTPQSDKALERAWARTASEISLSGFQIRELLNGLIASADGG
jgi:hypothetical protein